MTILDYSNRTLTISELLLGIKENVEHITVLNLENAVITGAITHRYAFEFEEYLTSKGKIKNIEINRSGLQIKADPDTIGIKEVMAINPGPLSEEFANIVRASQGVTHEYFGALKISAILAAMDKTDQDLLAAIDSSMYEYAPPYVYPKHTPSPSMLSMFNKLSAEAKQTLIVGAMSVTAAAISYGMS